MFKNAAFLHPASGISPHYAYLTWVKSIGAHVVETSMGAGAFKTGKPSNTDVLLLDPFMSRIVCGERENARIGESDEPD
jgi:hypothetical protein